MSRASHSLGLASWLGLALSLVACDRQEGAGKAGPCPPCECVCDCAQSGAQSGTETGAEPDPDSTRTDLGRKGDVGSDASRSELSELIADCFGR